MLKSKGSVRLRESHLTLQSKKMSNYIFILGKDTDLSLAELYAVYPDLDFSEIGDGFVILDLKAPFSQSDLDRLGGVIKVAEIERKTDKNHLKAELYEQILHSKEEGKLQYALSLFGWSESNLRSLLLDLKRQFKKKGVSSRFANQNFKNLSTAQYKGLRGKGNEFIVTKQGKDFYIARTIAIQNIDAYSQRDYDKPFRSMKMGMLPPKLAQILINLTQSNGVIWDPFCGGGTLVMEGLLMGRDMMGSDINFDHLEGAKQNVAWLQNLYHLKNKAELFVHDATRDLEGNLPQAIAFEGYLGPPQKSPLTHRQGQTLIPELEKLYVWFFQALEAVGFKGPVVMALPFFKTADGSEILLERALTEIERMGFKASSLLPSSNQPYLKYARKDQWVGRLVCRFEFCGKTT